MNCHAVLGVKIEDGHPPIDLEEWRRVPRIPMRMKGIRYARFQIIARKGGAHTWYIKVRLFQIAARFPQHRRHKLFGFGVVDELGFQDRKNFSALFRRQLLMYAEGVHRAKGLRNQFRRQLAELQSAWSRRIRKDTSPI